MDQETSWADAKATTTEYRRDESTQDPAKDPQQIKVLRTLVRQSDGTRYPIYDKTTFYELLQATFLKLCCGTEMFN